MSIKTIRRLHAKSKAGSIIAYLVAVLVVVSVIAIVSDLVIQTVVISHRRGDFVEAMQLAEGGVAQACADLEKAFTNKSSTFIANLTGGTSARYSLNSELSTPAQQVYQRTITTPFSNHQVTAQIWLSDADLTTAKVAASATIGKVTQATSVHLQLKFGYGAAIISDDPGTTSTGTSKSIAQQGNVVLNGDKTGPLVVNGGTGDAVLANGRANYDLYASVPPGSVSMTNYNTVDAIPDYTAEGSPDQLFNFKRFIAAADVSGNHYTNLTAFFAAANAAALLPKGALEGIIVVDIWKADKQIGNLDPAHLPNGINVRGTLVFNFSSEFDGSDKVINTSSMNINAADLSGLNAANPATYPTGYPPSYTNPAKNPVNLDMSGTPFPNFSPAEDLPALMYNVGILDIHGNANICGVLYSPSFMEIENKADGQVQYFSGSLIGGGGIYIENLKNSKTIVTYDPNAMDQLATSNGKGKKLTVAYWE
jgi:hypothetical protein